jgi:hypothetical protein
VSIFDLCLAAGSRLGQDFSGTGDSHSGFTPRFCVHRALNRARIAIDTDLLAQVEAGIWLGVLGSLEVRDGAMVRSVPAAKQPILLGALVVPPD